MLRVFYKYSACITIVTEDVRILCDPWFSENAYDGTWTQYPEISDINKLVGDFDIVYISHIHPDHYCSETLKILFKRYGDKEILIADWGANNTNFLEKKIKSDGLEKYLTITNKKIINNTEINIIPNKTGSISDIDTALIVTSKTLKKSILNINDCIYNETHFEKILNLKNKLNTEFSLFCLGYTGAGPYPQTYYSPKKENDILIKKSLVKKKEFFERYKKAIKKIPSVKRLPFAGKYMLKGDLSILNKYRGVADALEVKEFDKDAIILDDGGDAYFDVENNYVSRERKEYYKYPEIIRSKKDYFWRTAISFNPSKTLLKRLLIQSIKRAHSKSECNANYFYSIYTFENQQNFKEILERKKPYEKLDALITFNCKKDSNPFEKNIDNEIHSHLFIEAKALFAVLTGICHWNNYEVGSVFQVRRVPDIFNKEMQSYLNFLSII